MLGLIIAASSDIIEKSIKDIIKGVAKEYKIEATGIYSMLKFVHVKDETQSRLRVFNHYQGKRINDLPITEVVGSITKTMEGHIASIFMRDAKVFNVDVAFVNYVFQLHQGEILKVSPNIAGEYKGWYTLKEVLSGKFNKN